MEIGERISLRTVPRKRQNGSSLNCFRHSSDLLVRPPDMLVVAGHVKHRNARKCLSCPHDAFDSAVNVAGENNHVGGGVR
jgi:hypothetical protein